MKTLQLEINTNFIKSNDTFEMGSHVVMFTPDINKDYWIYRVKVSKTQSIIGFPKFGCIGVGFAVEDKDWNTNLPTNCNTEEIYNHIKVNKGAKHITKQTCLTAIKMIQDFVESKKKTC